MNTPEQAHELYKTMRNAQGAFTIEFISGTIYKDATSVYDKLQWDENARKGTGAIETDEGKIFFDFAQVRQIKIPVTRKL